MSKQLLSESLSCCWHPFLSSWFSLLFSLSSALCWWPWVLTTGGADVRLPAVFASPRGAAAAPTESGEKKKKSKEIKPNASHLLKCPKPWNSSKAGSTIFTMQPLFSQWVISNQSMTWFSISDFVVAYHALGLNVPATAGDLVPNWTQ